MMRPTLWPLLLVGFAALPTGAEAGAFNEPQGHGLVIIDGMYDTGDQFFNSKGHLVSTSSYEKREGYVYLQYGITDWLMAIAQPDIVSTKVSGPYGGLYTGPGTSQAGAQVQLPSFGAFTLALQGTLHVPTANRPQNPALVGNTSRDTDGRGLVGTVFTLGPWPGFLDLEAGYRIRGQHSPDEVHVDLTGGVRPRSDVLLMVQSFTTVPTQAGLPLYPRSTYSKLEGSAVYDFNAHWSVQLGVFGTVFGRDALFERGLDTAVWYRF